MPGRFLLRHARSSMEKLKGTSLSKQKADDRSSMCGTTILPVAKTQDLSSPSACPPAPLLPTESTFAEYLVPHSPLVEVKIACTTGPSQLRSVLPPSSRRSKSSENMDVHASGSSGSSSGSLKPLFTNTVLVLPSSPQQPASSPFLRDDEAESEDDAASDNIDLPFSLEEDDHPTPCHSVLATPVFASPAHSSTSQLSNLATFGSLSCECEPECIDPSLCTNFFSVGSSYHPLHSATSASCQYDFQPPSECSYRYINLSQVSSTRSRMMHQPQEEERGEDMGCSWAASPPARSAILATSKSTPKSFGNSPSDSYMDGPASYASSIRSDYSHDSDSDGEDKDEQPSNHMRAETVDDNEGPRGPAAPGLAGLLQQCSSLMDSDNRPSLSSFGINMNHPPATPTLTPIPSALQRISSYASSYAGSLNSSVHEHEIEGESTFSSSDILPRQSSRGNHHSVKIVERGFQPVRLPVIPSILTQNKGTSRKLSPILEV
ncbi:hypothetical protein IAT40_000776 [Kwoniella sp. CBS 6097]